MFHVHLHTHKPPPHTHIEDHIDLFNTEPNSTSEWQWSDQIWPAGLVESNYEDNGLYFKMANILVFDRLIYSV